MRGPSGTELFLMANMTVLDTTAGYLTVVFIAEMASAQQRALPQSKEALLKSYNKRLKDDIKSMLDNFVGKLNTAFIHRLECYSSMEMVVWLI